MKLTDYAIVVLPLAEEDGGGFAALVPDLPGCISDGETHEEAIRNVHDAITSWLETAESEGRDIPQPGDAVEKMKSRDKALFAAMKAAIDYAEHADGKIIELQRRLSELIAIMDTSPNGKSQRSVTRLLASPIKTLPVH